MSVQDQGDYSNASHGPREDTDAYSRDGAAHDPARPSYIDADRDRATPAGVALPHLRNAVRSPDEVERGRTRELPSWAPYVFAAAVFVALMMLGVAAVLQATKREPPPPPPEKPKIEDVGGVPVREDLNAPGL